MIVRAVAVETTMSPQMVSTLATDSFFHRVLQIVTINFVSNCQETYPCEASLSELVYNSVFATFDAHPT